jgi:3-oxoacyl-[acyl-carrier protein] reductase
MSSVMSSATKLNNAVALVTGASRGIGRAVAERLSAEGARVVGTATTAQGAETIGEYLRAHGGAGRVLDVRDPASIDTLIEDVGAHFGSIAILVNNAGVTRDQLLLRMKDDDWSQVLETDLTSVFRLSRAVTRGMMKARYGRIISIGSVVGSTGNAGQANYAAAKAGIIGFSKSLAAEIGSRNITVNVVAPGFIDTDMTQVLGEEVRKKIIERIVIPRLGTPAEIAAAVAFLASPESGYITGQTLQVNGGMFMN